MRVCAPSLKSGLLRNDCTQIFVLSMKGSLDGLIILVLVFTFMLIVYSTLIFYAEQSVETYDPVQKMWIRPDGSIRYFTY